MFRPVTEPWRSSWHRSHVVSGGVFYPLLSLSSRFCPLPFPLAHSSVYVTISTVTGSSRPFIFAYLCLTTYNQTRPIYDSLCIQSIAVSDWTLDERGAFRHNWISWSPRGARSIRLRHSVPHNFATFYTLLDGGPRAKKLSGGRAVRA